MLKIKLSRIGKKKHPIYRLIVSEVGRDPYGKNLEILGSYDPHTKALNVEADRVKHWISNGAQMTDTVNNLFVGNKIVEGKKVNVSALGKKAKDAVKKVAEDKKAEELAEKTAKASADAEIRQSAEDKEALEAKPEVVETPEVSTEAEVVEDKAETTEASTSAEVTEDKEVATEAKEE